MPENFEELDYAQTPLGELILRRRRGVASDQDIYEVKLDDAFLMSSLVNASEIALANRCIPKAQGEDIQVAIGGLGLGYTAAAALQHPSVGSVVVIEYLANVIEWHQRGLVPESSSLTSDPRCRLVNADFFALVGNPDLGLDLEQPGRQFDAILVDIDHTPSYRLDDEHGWFYEPEGTQTLCGHLHPGGVFGLWSADFPDSAFVSTLETSFETVTAEVISFPNPLLNIEDNNTIYVATHPRVNDCG
ncbi:MAG: spermidine synthase [Gemmatimonadetes bacterium]|nr:spermidine synthase [Gemmatimonadota bacterium]